MYRKIQVESNGHYLENLIRLTRLTNIDFFTKEKMIIEYYMEKLIKINKNQFLKHPNFYF